MQEFVKTFTTTELLTAMERRAEFNAMIENKAEGPNQQLHDIKLCPKASGSPAMNMKGKENTEKQRHGKGKALLPNSDYYSGMYKEGLRHGKGQYVFKGGAQYIGEYKNGMKDGVGRFHYPDGSRYKGEWKEDKRHGKGKYTYSQGDTYEGDWEKDERHGLGTYTYKASGVIMFGIWEKGKMEGRGKITYPTFTFHGIFLNNMPIGKGRFVFNEYCIQEGHYIHLKDESARSEEEAVGEEEEKMSPREGYPKGITPVWRPRKILPYSLDLIPPDPKLPPKPPPTPPPSLRLSEGEDKKSDDQKKDSTKSIGSKESKVEDSNEEKPEDVEGNEIENKEGLDPILEESSPEETLSPTEDEKNKS
ncbi:LOW QUALITY PROTEIN: radial spoke head 1 homolog [Homalodisca vitripennis]|uniref:LOW QUALITY PROTEIN: radial spoke head 1 homolog n=1 Tax=Homalodisca vitripennis TaxID=197043 RepID=UPI001EEA7F20|nr:LOW QUALITY PROTEIN: radial spoke head 1 homolog [Homalodisca vitripennis]